MLDPTPVHLEPSKLGEKNYWESTYSTELRNHTADPADQGHIWFDESDAEGRVAAYLDRLSRDDELQEGGGNGSPLLDRAMTSFLDLGTGNGSMLRTLRDDGWTGDMLGVDYSKAAVDLARQISVAAKTEEQQQPGEHVAKEQGKLLPLLRFEVWDLIAGEYESKIWSMPSMVLQNGDERWEPHSINRNRVKCWDVVLDKGTFDAISLSDEKDEQGRRIVEVYRERIKPLIARNVGILLVTSCNWTEDELVQWFVRPQEDGDQNDGGFKFLGKVKYPSFQFGGREGQAISSVCFKRI